MRFGFLLAAAGLSFGALAPASAQQGAFAQFPRWTAPALLERRGTDWLETPTSLADSVRRRNGYLHWKGAAIGAGTGGVLALLLGLAAGSSCDDCSDDDASWAWRGALLGAGAGGALGFLIGLASPRYEWNSVTAFP